MESTVQLPPMPRLQPNPGAELVEFRAQQLEATTTYGWIDRDAGVVRIPVERAIEILAQRGLPHR